ncbi:MAG: nitroreductase family protein [Syntrophomonas sp.]|nr:nitroreductase family protein [Syntrophomonas sp.]
MEAIFNRRSIRKYTDQDVSEEQIRILLKAAMSAPSAGNEQPWHFIVIRDRHIMEEITKYHPHSDMLKKAAAAIVVCADRNIDKFGVGYWVLDCAAATENILIAVSTMGLGAVWLGVYPREERCAKLRELFRMPENMTPFAIVSLGHPAEQKAPSNRFKEERIHNNTW